MPSADPDTLALVDALLDGLPQLPLGLPRLDILRGEEDGEGPAENLLGAVALDALGPRVPTDDEALGADPEDGVLLDVLQVQMKPFVPLQLGHGAPPVSHSKWGIRFQ